MKISNSSWLRREVVLDENKNILVVSWPIKGLDGVYWKTRKISLIVFEYHFGEEVYPVEVLGDNKDWFQQYCY